jgi:release factor glutamine methyltransferase
VGTGSGILAVCVAKYVPHSHVTAIDISPAALAVAQRNAERHGVVDRIEFVESNLFEKVPTERQFDYVVSNPPYVSTAEMAALAADVRDHEPHSALHAGPSGMDVIKPLVEQTATRMQPGGAIFIEVSPMIAAAVEQLIRESAEFELGPTIRDLAGHERVAQANYTPPR